MKTASNSSPFAPCSVSRWTPRRSAPVEPNRASRSAMNARVVRSPSSNSSASRTSRPRSDWRTISRSPSFSGGCATPAGAPSRSPHGGGDVGRRQSSQPAEQLARGLAPEQGRALERDLRPRAAAPRSRPAARSCGRGPRSPRAARLPVQRPHAFDDERDFAVASRERLRHRLRPAPSVARSIFSAPPRAGTIRFASASTCGDER